MTDYLFNLWFFQDDGDEIVPEQVEYISDADEDESDEEEEEEEEDDDEEVEEEEEDDSDENNEQITRMKWKYKKRLENYGVHTYTIKLWCT